MKVVVSLEQRFPRTPDGKLWSQSSCSYSFWARYLSVFSGVRILARVYDVPEPEPGWKLVTGENVSYIPLPNYLGPMQYLKVFLRIHRFMQGAVSRDEALIMRVPSPVAATLAKQLGRTHKPFGVEVVGDPYDVFAPGAVQTPLRPFLRWWFCRQLQAQCAQAVGCAYVTNGTLQARYPATRDAFVTHYSSIELSHDHIRSSPKTWRNLNGTVNLVTVASLAQLYKGTDTLITAVALCVRQGLDLRLTIIGDGKYRADLERQALDVGLGERVVFLGQVPGAHAVMKHLDRADVFVLPSRTEGLPRAVIEAMARGLPCIGSTAGGIPELLPPEDLVPPDDPHALAHKIAEVLGSEERMALMSSRNLATAQEYRDDLLQERRKALYQTVRERTETWLRG